MAAVRHLRFVKFKFLTDKKPTLRQHTIELFVIFKMTAAAILDF